MDGKSEKKDNCLAEQAYGLIKRRILDLTYAPGLDLTETFLAGELAMSRMPVRSALHRLRAEGLISSQYRQKNRVGTIDAKLVHGQYQLRRLLELPAVEKIFELDRTWEYSYLLEEQLLRIKAGRHDIFDLESGDGKMHRIIVGIFDNPLIDSVYESIQDQMIRIGMFLGSQQTPEYFFRQWQAFILAMREKRLHDAIAILDREHLGGIAETQVRLIENKERANG